MDQEMKTCALMMFSVFALLLPSAHAEKVFSEQPPFHAPLTAAEKALDLALKSRDGGKGSMTSSLLFVIEDTTEKQRKGMCANSGDRIETMRCEFLDIESAITCRKVFHAHRIFIYRTISANDRESSVDVRWPQYAKAGVPDWSIGSPIGNTYRLVWGKASWMIDGIDCGGIYKFNISIEALRGKFHFASTDPEIVLERILRINGDDSTKLYELVFGYRTRELAGDKELSLLFTQEFLARSRREEKALVTKSCGGKYPKNGIECDLIRGGVNPISCTQGSTDDHLYHTKKLSEKEVLVIYGWPGAIPSGYPYKMVRRNGHWMLDAVYCEGYGETPSP